MFNSSRWSSFLVIFIISFAFPVRHYRLHYRSLTSSRFLPLRLFPHFQPFRIVLLVFLPSPWQIVRQPFCFCFNCSLTEKDQQSSFDCPPVCSSWDSVHDPKIISHKSKKNELAALVDFRSATSVSSIVAISHSEHRPSHTYTHTHTQRRSPFCVQLSFLTPSPMFCFLSSSSSSWWKIFKLFVSTAFALQPTGLLTLDHTQIILNYLNGFLFALRRLPSCIKSTAKNVFQTTWLLTKRERERERERKKGFYKINIS